MRGLLFAGVLLIVPLAEASAQFGFSLYQSGVEITGDDLNVVGESVQTILNEGDVGDSYGWENPATGMHGETTLNERYEDLDTQCGVVVITARQGDRVAPFELRWCQRPDGTWGIAG